MLSPVETIKDWRDVPLIMSVDSQRYILCLDESHSHSSDCCFEDMKTALSYFDYCQGIGMRENQSTFFSKVCSEMHLGTASSKMTELQFQ